MSLHSGAFACPLNFNQRPETRFQVVVTTRPFRQVYDIEEEEKLSMLRTAPGRT
jgi:hypothetical protein